MDAADMDVTLVEKVARAILIVQIGTPIRPWTEQEYADYIAHPRHGAKLVECARAAIRAMESNDGIIHHYSRDKHD